jgi:hypothetical protein
MYLKVFKLFYNIMSASGLLQYSIVLGPLSLIPCTLTSVAATVTMPLTINDYSTRTNINTNNN